MNRLNRKFYTLLLSATVAVAPCMYGAEDKLKDDVVCCVPVEWKKYSTHIAVATITTAIVAYTVAVYMNKISSPVSFLKASILPLIVTSKIRFGGNNQKNDDKKNIVDIDDKSKGTNLDNQEDVSQVETSEVGSGLQNLKNNFGNAIEQMGTNGSEGYL